MSRKKTAYFVIGPESSGTRMLTESIVKCGVYGEATHKQKIDNYDFSDLPKKIVIRRSVPHGRYWPCIAGIIGRLKEENYKVIPILIQRDAVATIKSQLKNKHAGTEEEAKFQIDYAMYFIMNELVEAGTYPIILNYELFTSNEKSRKLFYKKIKLPVPEMNFFDGNKKYTEGLN